MVKFKEQGGLLREGNCADCVLVKEAFYPGSVQSYMEMQRRERERGLLQNARHDLLISPGTQSNASEYTDKADV